LALRVTDPSRSLARVRACLPRLRCVALRAPGRQKWVTGPFSREVAAAAAAAGVPPPQLPRLMSMGHCSEQRTGFEVTKDWNGADQVAIRSPRGASVRVSRFCSALPGNFFFFFGYISHGRSARHFWSRQKKLSFSRSDASVRLSAQVCLHGGQVVSWRNHRGEELLFSSSKVSCYSLGCRCWLVSFAMQLCFLLLVTRWCNDSLR